MKKIILVDGNNLLFRSYYATAYNGVMMRNSNGTPTNALYGFVEMINKILNEEKPEYMAVAFDIGKNFRKQKYETYKAGRVATPEELKQQMPIAREILEAMGIKYFELEPFEADDIIGTLAKVVSASDDFEATIVSSDKDLLQLISPLVDVKLLKQKDFIRFNRDTFFKEYGFEPIRMIDYKGLAGDPSDNIPGVKGIGDKTAISLLQKYDTIEDIYNHIDELKGATKEKLLNDKEAALTSKEIATIYCDVPITNNLNDMKCTGPNEEKLLALFQKLEFNSLIKKFNIKKSEQEKEIKFINILSANEIEETDIYSIYIEGDKENYHDASIVGMGISTVKNNYYVPKLLIPDVINKINNKIIYTFDLKKDLSLLNNINSDLLNVPYDLMISAYLLELSDTDDIYDLMTSKGITIKKYSESLKQGFEPLDIVKKARFVMDTKDDLINKLKLEDMYDLFTKIEMPLVRVLYKMEHEGVKCDANVLTEMGSEVKAKIDIISERIKNEAGEDFNISSPRQLGDILFDKLKLPYGKKNKNGYSTDAKILQKLVSIHPIINDILEYRNLTKLYTTYLEGLIPYIKEDGKIHTIYKQNLTRTGRLSSIEPNLQNIPARDEDGRKVRKAFLPSNDLFMSCDYSQIELRILAHISDSKELQQAFINDEDIHRRVAADINGIPIEEVTPSQRKAAKAVIFGIVYGISGFGLGESLSISPKEAKKFIDKYYEIYPGVRKYMDNIVLEAYQNGSVRTLLNRKRSINELQSKAFMVRQAGERIALNTPIQGTGADIMKKAMVDIDREFQEKNIKSKMVMQVHDELIFDCIKEEQTIVEKIVKEKMENVIKLNVPIKVSCDVGNNWYTTK
jgi:DNA polymerase-1